MQLRRQILTLRLACATALALLVVGCTTQSTTSTPPKASAMPTESFSSTDIAWIQLMIPMAERAQQLTDLAPSHAASPELAELAATAGARLHEDQTRLRELLKLAGVPDSNPHEGHNMPGMVSLPTLEKAGAATGKVFDQILADALRAHLNQSTLLCAGERSEGHAGAVKKFAASLARNTTAQVARLNDVSPARSAAPSNAAAGG
ncbi:DUF305 domain-containing protein [Streptomyces sp. R08]|uniref:DUF305 domain-containing protein n=1 Tax=Streptomyces sp. R08 TaxID=3238624 RepID=A0AB39MQS0_9ACTN